MLTRSNHEPTEYDVELAIHTATNQYVQRRPFWCSLKDESAAKWLEIQASVGSKDRQGDLGAHPQATHKHHGFRLDRPVA